MTKPKRKSEPQGKPEGGYETETSERPVVGFRVIRPDFTLESIAQAMQLTVESGTPVTLTRAVDLKEIAERWEKKSGGNTDDPFPLGHHIQPGILNTALVAAT